MYTVNRTALVPYSAAQMYALVKDIESYAEFLPWCSGSKIHEFLDDGVIASVDISKGAVKQSFMTRNEHIEGREIRMQLEKGPFSQLSGAWVFRNIGTDGSRVSLDLKFDFSSTLARVTIGPIFNNIADKLVDAFVERSLEIYG